jgi:hypothetical protein
LAGVGFISRTGLSSDSIAKLENAANSAAKVSTISWLQRVKTNEQLALTCFREMQLATLDSLVDRARRRSAKLGRVFRYGQRRHGGAFLAPGIDGTSCRPDHREAARLNSYAGSVS